MVWGEQHKPTTGTHLGRIISVRLLLLMHLLLMGSRDQSGHVRRRHGPSIPSM